MKNLIIIGAGPRGLAMALQALKYKDKFNISIVDPNPMSTWKFPYMLPDMEMRSPITFDLVTFQRDMKQYSLAKFLKEEVVAESQKEVEDNTLFCRRKEFVNYLKYIIVLLKQGGVSFVPRKTLGISDTFITTDKGNLYYDYLVVAMGKSTQETKCPSYLRNKKLLSTSCLFNCGWSEKIVNVVGSGQQAAEVVDYLCGQRAEVNWLQKHTPKVHQYPVPSFKDWGITSALGPYYSKARINKADYIRRVKQWGPSITPYINNRLETRNYKITKDITNTNSINMEGQFFLATGFNQEVKLLNTTFDIKKNRNNTNLPDIVNSFQSSSHPNIYFTGGLATHFDGPRQGSIISSGLTAHTILLSILKNNG